jgi:hypothetical protein
MSLFLYRLLGAAMLDASMYEGIEADRRATPQAFAAVVLASFAAGVGLSSGQGGAWPAIAMLTGLALVTWMAWAMLMFQLGTRALPEPETSADLGQLLRTIGFASGPGCLMALGLVPALAWPAFLVAGVWMFAAMVVAVRHALDYHSYARAIAVCALGAALSLGLAFAIGLLFGPVAS